jgi:adenine phosphoribosyltransferase
VTSVLNDRLIRLFRWVDPGPASEHLVSDVSAWWRDPTVLAAIGPALAQPFRADRPTVVLAPEVTGVLLGPLVAVALGVGFVSAHKEGDGRTIAESATRVRTAPDHLGRRLSLGVRDRHLGPGDRVLIVDDWVGTGAQSRALWDIVGARGAEPVGTAAVVADCRPAVARALRLRALLTAAQLGG